MMMLCNRYETIVSKPFKSYKYRFHKKLCLHNATAIIIVDAYQIHHSRLYLKLYLKS